MDIYVGSIPFKWKQIDVETLFSEFGEVTSVKIIIDNITRQNKGFGFVTMSSNEDAQKAIKALDGTEHLGRTIKVSLSDPSSQANPTSTGEDRKRSSSKNQPNYTNTGKEPFWKRNKRRD